MINPKYRPEDLQKLNEGSMGSFLEISFLEVTEDHVKAKMPVNEKTMQPFGILNGGASVAMAETVASTAANACIDLDKFYAVGLDINANHLKSARDGFVYATAKPLHLGAKTQVWEIKIENEQEQLVCIARLTVIVLPRK